MKKLLVILMIFALSISIIACNNDEETPPTEEPVVENPNEEDPEPESIEVTLYFVSEEYIETGDESLEKLVPERREFIDTEENLGEAIVRALMEGTESEEARTVIPSTSSLNGVEITDGTAYVDFASDGMHGGSLEETFTINQIVASLIELDSVDNVQFLIDGEVGDSLMGHYSIDEPFENVLGHE